MYCRCKYHLLLLLLLLIITKHHHQLRRNSYLEASVLWDLRRLHHQWGVFPCVRTGSTPPSHLALPMGIYSHPPGRV